MHSWWSQPALRAFGGFAEGRSGCGHEPAAAAPAGGAVAAAQAGHLRAPCNQPAQPACCRPSWRPGIRPPSHFQVCPRVLSFRVVDLQLHDEGRIPVSMWRIGLLSSRYQFGGADGDALLCSAAVRQCVWGITVHAIPLIRHTLAASCRCAATQASPVEHARLELILFAGPR